MPNITPTAIAMFLLTGAATSPAWAETFEHGVISMPPPAISMPTPTPQQQTSVPAITRPAFPTAISGREPVDRLERISAGQQVYYFTEVTGLQGHVITHKWERDGAFQLGLQFPIAGSPWRVNSSKSISPNLPGTWTVTVQNDDGSILSQETLIVDPLIPAPAQPLTQIPPDMQRTPAPRPAPLMPTGNEETPIIPNKTPRPELPEKPSDDARPIWESLPR